MVSRCARHPRPIVCAASALDPDDATKVPAIMASMTIGTVPVSIIGGRFAMGHQPFWWVDLSKRS